MTNNLDLTAFVLAVVSPTIYKATYGLDPQVVFDLDSSGGFNNLDISGFINVIQGY